MKHDHAAFGIGQQDVDVEVIGLHAVSLAGGTEGTIMAEDFVYDRERRAWVNDGHVFVEAYNGTTLRLTPEVAINMGRLLERLGSDSLINKVMSSDATSTEE